MTPSILIPIIALLAIVFVVQPLLSKGIDLEQGLVFTEKNQEQKLADTLEAWNELEFDYLMNKMAEEDYEAMSRAYKQEAIVQMEKREQEEIQDYNMKQTIRKELEAEVDQALQNRFKGRPKT